MMRVLVVGATGNLGEPVARRLQADGYAVRLLARNPTAARDRFGDRFEVVGGDVTQFDTLPSAMAQCDVVYANLRGDVTLESFDDIERLGAINLGTAALRCGVRRFGYISGSGIGDWGTAPAPAPLFALKAAVVQAVKASGVEYTIFRPTHFMESLSQFIRNGSATVIGQQPHRYHYLAADDYAGLVSKALRDPAAANQTFDIFGPDAYTMAEALQIYTSVLCPQVKVGSMPLFAARWLGRLTRTPELTFAAMLFGAFAAFGEHGDATLTTQLLGTPRTTLREWCERQAAARKAGSSREVA